MTSTTKQLALINELTELTKAGSLRWEKTSIRGAYAVAFPNYSIRISQDLAALETHNLGIFDGSGNMLAEIGDDYFYARTPEERESSLQLNEPLSLLYHMIRRIVEAEDQEKAIDAVLGNLRQLGSAGAKAG